MTHSLQTLVMALGLIAAAFRATGAVRIHHSPKEVDLQHLGIKAGDFPASW